MTAGYGTAALGRSISKRERIRLVEVAYDAGIRWFDTAPLYGAGAAEVALGIALRGRDDAIVATKVGIVPPGIVGIALRRPARAGRFAPAAIRSQLEGSLRRMSRDSTDVVLLHEVEAATAPAALDALESLREESKLRRAGIATGQAQTTTILAARAVDVVQVRADAVVDTRGAVLVVHSVLAGRSEPAADLLRTAAHEHPGAIVLVGSRDPVHIREAAEVLG